MIPIPGDPNQNDGAIPKELQPTQTDLLMAAAIMHQQGKFQTAMVKPLSEQQILAPEPLPPRTRLEREEYLEQREIIRPQPHHGLEVEPKDIRD
jgi:hypothetical protein